MQEDRIKVVDKYKSVTLIFDGPWNQVSKLVFFFSSPPPTQHNLSIFFSPGFELKMADITVV